MVNGKCSKNYLKDFNTQTNQDQDGYPRYRRLDNGVRVK